MPSFLVILLLLTRYCTIRSEIIERAREKLPVAMLPEIKTGSVPKAPNDQMYRVIDKLKCLGLGQTLKRSVPYAA